MTTLGLVDYGMGNRRSMQKSLERAGATVVLSGDHD
jgi:glutamine amidotransferase